MRSRMNATPGDEIIHRLQGHIVTKWYNLFNDKFHLRCHTCDLNLGELPKARR